MTGKKTVLITGASRGIGRATALLFAKNGFSLALTARDPGKLAGTADMIREATGANVICLTGDISDPCHVSSLFSLIKNEYGRLDVLVNNAGIDSVGLLQDTSFEEWNRILSVNLTGAFLCCREAVPMMLSARSGSIVNVSSVYAQTGAATESAYAASKGGLDAMTRSLSKELSSNGIRVNGAAFGPVDTDMNSHLSPEDRELVESEIPMGRMASPEEAALFIYHIAVTFTYLTGRILTMDGGWAS